MLRFIFLLGLLWNPFLQAESLSLSHSPILGDLAVGWEKSYDENLRLFAELQYQGAEQETEEKGMPYQNRYETEIHLVRLGGKRGLPYAFELWGASAVYSWDGACNYKVLNQPSQSFAYSGWGLNAEMGIGNRWRISESISLGVDWFQLSYSLIRNTLSEQSYEYKVARGVNEAETNQEMERMLDRMMEIRRLRISIIWDF